MAYSNVGTPKFYVDTLSWLIANGTPYSFAGERIAGIGFNPSKIYDYHIPEDGLDAPFIVYLNKNVGITPSLSFDFCAILGHNYGDRTMGLYKQMAATDAATIDITEIVNGGGVGGGQIKWNSEYNGFTILRIDNMHSLTENWDTFKVYKYSLDETDAYTYKTGSVALGQTYTMPHSPELSLTMTREMDGVKRIRTKGGADLVDHKYIKPAMWGTLAPWELAPPSPLASSEIILNPGTTTEVAGTALVEGIMSFDLGDYIPGIQNFWGQSEVTTWQGGMVLGNQFAIHEGMSGFSTDGIPMSYSIEMKVSSEPITTDLFYPWGEFMTAYNSGAELSRGQKLSRSGRRVWDLSFNHLSDSDIFPMLSSLSPYEGTSATGVLYSTAAGTVDTSDDWYAGETLLDDDTFLNQVIHKTNGGQLPFIFQPDSNNNNPDGFAICKFDMKEFKFDQVANGVYNMKLKIREVW